MWNEGRKYQQIFLSPSQAQSHLCHVNSPSFHKVCAGSGAEKGLVVPKMPHSDIHNWARMPFHFVLTNDSIGEFKMFHFVLTDDRKQKCTVILWQQFCPI